MDGLCQREALNLVSQQIKYTVCHQWEPGEMKDGLVVFIHSPHFLFLLSSFLSHCPYLSLASLSTSLPH